MNYSHTLSLSLLTTVLLGVGCVQPQTASNTNVNIANDNETVEVVTNTNENTNTELGSEMDTSDWKTYTDERYISGEMLSGDFPSFSIQYPNDWLVDETLGGPVIYTPSMQSGDLPIKPEDFIVSIGNFVEDRNTNYADVPSTIQDCVDIIQQRNSSYTVSNVDFIKNNQGIDVAVFDYTFADTTTISRLYCLVQDDKAVTVSGSPVDSDFISTFTVMIDSLKFN